MPRQLHQVGELAKVTPEVVECRRITGEDCYVMTSYVRDVEHLEELSDRFAAYGQTTTSLVQSTPVPTRGLAIDTGAATSGEAGQRPVSRAPSQRTA